MVAMLAYIGVLTAPEPTDTGDAEGWAQRQQELTNRLAKQPRDRALLDRIIDNFLFNDTIPEMAEAAARSGVSHGQLDAWLEHAAPDAVPRMPSLGLFREAIREKHLDPKTQWEVNGLFDLATASCAAAYCDHITVDRRQKEVSVLQHAGWAAEALSTERSDRSSKASKATRRWATSTLVTRSRYHFAAQETVPDRALRRSQGDGHDRHHRASVGARGGRPNPV